MGGVGCQAEPLMGLEDPPKCHVTVGENLVIKEMAKKWVLSRSRRDPEGGKDSGWMWSFVFYRCKMIEWFKLSVDVIDAALNSLFALFVSTGTTVQLYGCHEQHPCVSLQDWCIASLSPFSPSLLRCATPLLVFMWIWIANFRPFIYIKSISYSI